MDGIMLCKTYLFIVSYLFNTCWTNYQNRIVTKLKLLSPKRSSVPRVMNSYFIPFQDMPASDLRIQNLGFTKGFHTIQRLIQQSDKSSVNYDLIINRTLYIIAQIVDQTSTETLSPIPSVRELLHDSVQLWGEGVNNFIEPLFTQPKYDAHRIMKSMYSEPYIRAKSYKPIATTPLIMNAWRLVYLGYLSQWFDNGQISRKGPNQDQLSLYFIKLLCEYIQYYPILKKYLANGFCPNPCLRDPCSIEKIIGVSTCIVHGSGVSDYLCKCSSTQNKGITSSNKCMSTTSCKSVCDLAGTRRCETVYGRHLCTCRETHMGPTCRIKRDPCVSMPGNVLLPGNVACNVGEGGICNGIIGTNTYSCVCPNTRIADVSYPYPNCLGFKDRCASVICVYGDCISSKDGQQVYCQCSEDAYGQNCELMRGTWSAWSPWSECTPNCASFDHPKRIRTRTCLGQSCYGTNGHLQIEFCAPKPCPSDLIHLATQGEIEETVEVEILMLKAETTRYVKIVSAIAEALLLVSCLFAALVCTIMIVIVVIA